MADMIHVAVEPERREPDAVLFTKCPRARCDRRVSYTGEVMVQGTGLSR